MEAIREIKTVKNNKLIIHLPAELGGKKVEVIVLPYDSKKEKKNNKSKTLKDILNVSVWSVDDIEAIEKAQKLLNQWNMPKF